jgi:predicted transcriptional regulator
MASTRTKRAVLESYTKNPGQTFEAASHDVDRSKSTVHVTVNELVREGKMVKTNCPHCGGPMWKPKRGGGTR